MSDARLPEMSESEKEEEIKFTQAGEEVPPGAPPLPIFDKIGNYVRTKNRKRRRARKRESE